MRCFYLEHRDCLWEPKTTDFCAICQRDLKPGQRRVSIWTAEGEGAFAVHPDDVDSTCRLVPIGANCARKIDPKFVVR